MKRRIKLSNQLETEIPVYVLYHVLERIRLRIHQKGSEFDNENFGIDDRPNRHRVFRIFTDGEFRTSGLLGRLSFA